MPNNTEQQHGHYKIAFGYRHRSNISYFDDTPLKDEWQREVYLEAADLMARHDFSTVYDVGCGSGYKLIKYLGKYNTIGFDLPETVAFLQKNYPGRKWISGLSAGSLAKADLVICSDVLEHVVDPDTLLDFIANIATRYIVLSTPDRAVLHSEESDLFLGPPVNRCHVREWTFEEFAAYISDHFEILNHRITNRTQATQMIVCQVRDPVLKKKNFSVGKLREAAARAPSESGAFIELLHAARESEEFGRPDDEVISAYLEALAACPARAEALHGAARFCRKKGIYERGYQFATQGLAIAYPKDALCVETWIYEYGLLDELAVNAYWSGKYAECAEACDRLLNEGKLPTEKRDRVLKNRNFAVSKQQEIAASSSPESEAFLMLLRAAREKEKLGRPDDEVISTYMEATAACPTRTEALYGAARYCRNKSLHERGFGLAAQGLAIPYSKDAPAVEDWINEYGLLDELAVNAYWTGRYAECVNACDRLLREGMLPTDQRERVLKNKQFAIDKLAHDDAEALTTLPVGRSFDLFDTLVTRRCVYPHEIFARVERVSGRAGFAQARRAAEAEISSGQYTLDDIYRRLAEHHGVPTEEADRLKSLELEVEAGNLFPIVEHCREVGPSDVVVSDMYLPAEWLTDIVRQTCDLTPRELYVSSHGKRQGTVWQTIGQTMKLTEHVGDNPVTDQASAQAAGISARLTTVARRTEIEDELAAAGFSPLSNLIREARLTTWHDDPASRRAQIRQVQLNFPLLFLSTIHLWKLSTIHGWDNILMSGRDCYLWHQLYGRTAPLLPGAPPASYFYTSRITRAHPSSSYLAYFNHIRTGRRNLVVDLCGTGWSVTRLVEQAPEPDTEIFLLHKIDLPHLMQRYEKLGPLGRPIDVNAVISRPPVRADNDVLEDLNRALHGLVEDVQQVSGGFVPVYATQDQSEKLAELIRIHHAAFERACALVPMIGAEAIKPMLDTDVAPLIEAAYRRMSGIYGEFKAFYDQKTAEEAVVWKRLADKQHQDARNGG